MLGIPFFSVWVLETFLFVIAVVIGIWFFDSELPWRVVLGLMAAIVLLALLGSAIHKLGRESKSES